MPRGQRKTTLRDDAEQTHNTILHTAEQLFMEHGYRAVSTRQIADACGLTQPALYHHFSDKQDLYVAVIKENIAKTQSALERIARRNDSVQERLHQVIRYLFASTQHDISLMLHDIQHELDSEVRVILNDLFHHGLIAPIAAIFHDGVDEGFLRDSVHGGVDEITAAYLFMSMLSRFLSHSQHTNGLRSSNENEQAEIIIHILLFGLATPDNLIDK